MIEAIVGSTNAERVLSFLDARESGYASEIAKLYGVGPSMVQKQLDRMERDGLLVHESVGRMRIYSFNPRYAFTKPLRNLMSEVRAAYPKKLRDELELNRRRPRKKNKPL